MEAERLAANSMAILAPIPPGREPSQLPDNAPAWERALWHSGLQELSYQPGQPRQRDLRVISYNLNALPFGASLFGGPGHDFRDARLHEFVGRPELKKCHVLLLQEVFATPVLRSVLCRQTWLLKELAAKGFVHQVPSPRRPSPNIAPTPTTDRTNPKPEPPPPDSPRSSRRCASRCAATPTPAS